ncbi:MAG: integrase arm-type DNA-binding domain-containing protein [Thiolinea sp.]
MKKYQKDKLTDPEVRHAKPQDKPYKLQDGGGLYCEVLTTGSRVWRYRYKFGVPKPDKQGRLIKPEKTFTIGTYPDVGLSEARKIRDQAKQKVSDGIDPSAQKQIQKRQSNINSFECIAEEWFSEYKGRVAESTSIRAISYLRRDVYPVIGSREAGTLTAPEIIPVIKRVASRGALDAARRVKEFIQQVFDYAVAHGRTERNPAKDINLQLILPKNVKRHFSAITDPAGIADLLRATDAYQGNVSVKYALKLSPLLFLRPSELRCGEWSEIDLNKAVWTLPAARRKLPTHIKAANRAADALIIPLPRQAVSLLAELHQYTGSGQYLFPSPRGKTTPISNNAVRVALRTMGYANDEMTAHGYRGMASTCLNTMGYRSDVIEAALGHAEQNEVRAAYNRSDYLEERKSMMQEWANYLDGLKAGADVIPIWQRKQA